MDEEIKLIPRFNYRYGINAKAQLFRFAYIDRMGRPQPFMEMKVYKEKRGYINCILVENGKMINVHLHRLVALVFIPNPLNLPCVNHKDGNKSNCLPSNLEWCTNAQNSAHAVKAGLIKSGSKSYQAKITENDVIAMRSLPPRSFKLKELAKKYSMSESNVSEILKRKIWKHVA